MKTFATLLRREIWEHRAFVIVPIVIFAVIIIGDMAAIIKGADQFGLRAIGNHMADGAAHLAGAGEEKLETAMGVILFVLGMIFSTALAVVVLFYLLDCLYADRKDRSVLFWKSLPISDLETVGAKLFIAIIAAPVIAVVAALATYLALLIIGSVIVLFGGANPFSLLWANAPLFTGPLRFLSFAIANAVWLLPLYCWLLFCSATARKAPFLVAVLVPAGIAFLEWLAFDSNRFGEALGNYFAYFYESAFGSLAGRDFGITIDGDEINVAGSLSDLGDAFSPFFSLHWVLGLTVAAALFAATVWMRRYRAELA